MPPQFETDAGRRVTAVTTDETREVDRVAVGDLALADVGIPRGVSGEAGVGYTDPFAGARRVCLRLR